MRAICLVLLCVCALTNALSIFDKRFEGTAIQHHLDRCELQVSGKTRMNYQDDLNAHEELIEKSVGQRNIISEVIESMLEDFKEVVINGNGELPPLDPYVIDELGPFQYTTSGMRVETSIHNLRMEGLMWYVVDKVIFNPVRLSLSMQLTIPRLTLTARYNSKARISLINHTAGGNIRVFLNRVIMGIDGRVGVNVLAGGSMYLREFKISLDIHDTFINIEGMTGSSVLNALINNQIQSITQETIQNELANVSEELSNILFEVIDGMLRDLTAK